MAGVSLQPYCPQIPPLYPAANGLSVPQVQRDGDLLPHGCNDATAQGFARPVKSPSQIVERRTVEIRQLPNGLIIAHGTVALLHEAVDSLRQFGGGFDLEWRNATRLSAQKAKVVTEAHGSDSF
jgi:hypothetical protein